MRTVLCAEKHKRRIGMLLLSCGYGGRRGKRRKDESSTTTKVLFFDLLFIPDSFPSLLLIPISHFPSGLSTPRKNTAGCALLIDFCSQSTQFTPINYLDFLHPAKFSFILLFLTLNIFTLSSFARYGARQSEQSEVQSMTAASSLILKQIRSKGSWISIKLSMAPAT